MTRVLNLYFSSTGNTERVAFKIEDTVKGLGVRARKSEGDLARAPIAKFIEQKGEVIHHISLRAEGIEKALEKVQKSGIKLIDDKLRIGAHGLKRAQLWGRFGSCPRETPHSVASTQTLFFGPILNMFDSCFNSASLKAYNSH